MVSYGWKLAFNMGPFKGLRQEDEDTAIAVLFSDFYQANTDDDEDEDLSIAVRFNEFNQINLDEPVGEDSEMAFDLDEFCQVTEETESQLVDVKFDELHQKTEGNKADKKDKVDNIDEKNKRNKKEKKEKKNKKNKKRKAATEEGDGEDDPAVAIQYNEFNQTDNKAEQAKKTEEVIWERTEDGIWVKKDTNQKEKKKRSKCAFSNYNEHGQIKTKSFNKSQASRGFWASFFDMFIAIFEEITGFGPGLKAEKYTPKNDYEHLSGIETDRARNKREKKQEDRERKHEGRERKQEDRERSLESKEMKQDTRERNLENKEIKQEDRERKLENKEIKRENKEYEYELIR